MWKCRGCKWHGSGNIHSPEEALNIDDAIDGMEIYAKAIMELANLWDKEN